jgi:hypothetical protein
MTTTPYFSISSMDDADEHQGGAVDVRTRAGVKEWNWEFTVRK